MVTIKVRSKDLVGVLQDIERLTASIEVMIEDMRILREELHKKGGN